MKKGSYKYTLLNYCSLAIITVAIIILVGCSNQPESFTEDQITDVFTLDNKTQQLYTNQIITMLDSLYWKYDKSSIIYTQSSVPNKNNTNYALLQQSCNDIGMDITKYSGNSAITATIDLIHFNNETAGIAEFYFVNDEIVGGFHSPEYDRSLPISLKMRNVFTEKAEFLNYEDVNKTTSFSSTVNNTPVTPFYAIDKNKMGSIENNIVVIYKYTDKFTIDKKITIEKNLIPMSITFLEDGATLAVLIGEKSTSEINTETEYQERTNSTKVVFYDQYYNKLKTEIILNYPNYSMITQDDGYLVLGAENSLHYYNYIDNEWQKYSQTPLTHSVKFFTKADIDGSGNNYYIMTNGMDVYLYTKKNKNFYILWKTHLSLEHSFNGPIYCADLNGDGIKEIYIEDQTFTVIRYILTENGLITQNEDILFGERIFAGDFNNSGKDDYIKVTNPETNEQYIYIAD